VVHLDQLLPHMRRVLVAERDLCDLSVLWQMIETSAAISCPEEVSSLMPTLVDTRERFDAMRTRLVERMVEENRAALGDDLGARAQCAIDILVRNLYERTADVGFLATDGPVVEFCETCAANADTRAAQREGLRARLREYQAKYTVYEDIALLAPDGEVLLRLDDARPLERSHDPVAAQALASGTYVEAFGASDLGRDPAVPCLRYAHRIVNARGQAVGVLVLRFRFADEMERIFADVSDAHGQIAIVLLDEANRVIVTNDEAHVPLGARFATLPLGSVALTTFAGREYLAMCCASQGYQGYPGPRWRALAMVSLLTAFNTSGDATSSMTGTQLATGELSAVERDADAINRELRRVIWNGRLMTGQSDDGRARLKAVLRQVSLAGVRTRRRLEHAIVDLSATSFGRTCRQAQQLARLAADIMDRNLYERANDCRWWALSPVLRRELAAPDSAESRSAVNGVLDTINGLYTVYSRLVAFDTQGVIRGASRTDGHPELPGSSVPEAWLQRVRGLQGSQHYAVSDFGPTSLHDNGDTYVYLAAVRAEHDERVFAGGVAIVFNAAKELSAMLTDILGTRAGHAAFVDAHGRVLAATHPELAGKVHPQGRAASNDNGELIDVDGTLWACASAPASGYREFKKSDGYDNQVRAIVGLQIGATERRGLRLSDHELSSPNQQPRGMKREMAVFQVGSARYALDSADVLEVVSTQHVVRSPGAASLVVGMLPLAGGPAGDGRAVPVICARRLTGLTLPARATDGVVLLLRRSHAGVATVFGLRVDDVLSVIEVPERDLHPVPAGTGGFAASLKGLIDCLASNGNSSEKVLVQLLDAQRLADALGPAQVALAA
jgi:chemotaxis signal transduction protein